MVGSNAASLGTACTGCCGKRVTRRQSRKENQRKETQPEARVGLGGRRVTSYSKQSHVNVCVSRKRGRWPKRREVWRRKSKSGTEATLIPAANLTNKRQEIQSFGPFSEFTETKNKGLDHR
jgi:hypothetical protein